MKHDIVVIGTSAGGVEALKKLLSGIPENFPASIFITIHTSPEGPGYLAHVLGRVCPLPVDYAQLKEDLQPGRIYLCRPNLHLIIKRGQVMSRFLAKENGLRPAIDPMFRSAAYSYGKRVVGIILTGNLDDGVAGLGIIKDEGGIAIVQDPKEALFNSMPAAALKYVPVDYVTSIADMPRLLVDVINSEVTGKDIMTDEEAKQTSQVMTCPGCGGVLKQYISNDSMWYQCQVGHRFSPEAMMLSQNNAIEEKLWSAIALLKQKADVNEVMASDARTSPPEQPVDPEYYEKQSGAAREIAEAIENILQKNGDILFPGPPSKNNKEELNENRKTG